MKILRCGTYVSATKNIRPDNQILLPENNVIVGSGLMSAKVPKQTPVELPTRYKPAHSSPLHQRKSFFQQSLDRFRADRGAEEEALAEVAAHLGELDGVFLGFDAFGNHLHLEFAGHGDDRTQEDRALVAGVSDQ